MMKRLITSALVSVVLAANAHAQVSDDINIDLTVTAQPSITIVPPLDVTFTSDGVTASPPARVTSLCFETSLTNVRITVAKLNALNNSLPSLINTAVSNYINYSLVGGISGIIAPSTSFNTVDTEDFSLNSADLGVAGCGPTFYRFFFTATPATGGVGQTIADAVSQSNLDDGTPYAFSDVLTITLEPVL